jgi:hypothetical protein
VGQWRGARRLLRPWLHKVCGTPCPSRHALGALPHTPHGGASQRRLAPSGGAQGAQIAMRRCCAQRTSVSEGRQAPRRRTEPLIGVARGATDPHVACSTACRTTLARQVHSTQPHVLCGGFSLAQARRALEPACPTGTVVAARVRARRTRRALQVVSATAPHSLLIFCLPTHPVWGLTHTHGFAIDAVECCRSHHPVPGSRLRQRGSRVSPRARLEHHYVNHTPVGIRCQLYIRASTTTVSSSYCTSSTTSEPEAKRRIDTCTPGCPVRTAARLRLPVPAVPRHAPDTYTSCVKGSCFGMTTSGHTISLHLVYAHILNLRGEG